MNYSSPAFTKNYRIVNLVILFYLLILFLLPFIDEKMKSTIPSVWRCSYRTITHKPCPYCGITRDAKNIIFNFQMMLDGKIHFMNKLSPFLAFIIPLEFIIRIATLLLLARKKTGKKYPATDIFIHIVMIIALIVYDVTFFLK